MAPDAKFCPKLFRGHASRAAFGQNDQNVGKAPSAREADVVEKPQVVPIETRNRTQRISGPVVGDNPQPVNTLLPQKSPHV